MPNVKTSFIPILVVWILAGVLLSACGSDTPTSIIENTPSDVVLEIGQLTPEYEVVSYDIHRQNNCGGNSEATYGYEQSRSVQHIITVDNEFTVNVNGEVGVPGTSVELGSSVSIKLGQSYGEEERITRVLTLKAQPGTQMEHRINLIDVWQTGTAKILLEENTIEIPFRYRSDFALELAESKELNCESYTSDATSSSVSESIYDNFDNSEFDNSYNMQLWRLAGTPPSPKARQQNGIMSIINSNSQENSAAVLVAREFDGFVIDTPLFIEADLSYSGDGVGNVALGLYNSKTLEWGDWSSECNFAIDNGSFGGKCFDHKWTGQSNNYFETPWIEFYPNTWHNFRIEVDPTQFTITYFIDETEVSSHIPGDSELLKQTDLQIALVTWKNSSDGTLTGLFDNVRIGKIAQ